MFGKEACGSSASAGKEETAVASATRELRYKNRSAVNGSLAYELEWEDRERELRHAGEAPLFQEETRTRQTAKVHTAAKVQVREAQHVSATSVLGVAAVICMALLVLASYINLTVISAETVDLQQELVELETENVALTARYEQMFDMTTVKEVARAAGMDKPSSSQVCYIDLTGGDHAVVYQQEEPSVLDRMLETLHRGVCAAVEYFN